MLLELWNTELTRSEWIVAWLEGDREDVWWYCSWTSHRGAQVVAEEPPSCPYNSFLSIPSFLNGDVFVFTVFSLSWFRVLLRSRRRCPMEPWTWWCGIAQFLERLGCVFTFSFYTLRVCWLLWIEFHKFCVLCFWLWNHHGSCSVCLFVLCISESSLPLNYSLFVLLRTPELRRAISILKLGQLLTASFLYDYIHFDFFLVFFSKNIPFFRN